MVQRPGAVGRPWGQCGQMQGSLRGSCPPGSSTSACFSLCHPQETQVHTNPFMPTMSRGLYTTLVTDHSSVTPATEDVCYQGTLALRQSLSSHRAMGTLVVLLTSQISDLRTKVTVGNRKGVMLTWTFQNVPSSGSLSPSFTDGSLLTTESVSPWMWVHWCYPILKWAVWQGIFCSPDFSLCLLWGLQAAHGIGWSPTLT